MPQKQQNKWEQFTFIVYGKKVIAIFFFGCGERTNGKGWKFKIFWYFLKKIFCLVLNIIWHVYLEKTRKILRIWKITRVKFFIPFFNPQEEKLNFLFSPMNFPKAFSHPFLWSSPYKLYMTFYFIFTNDKIFLTLFIQKNHHSHKERKFTLWNFFVISNIKHFSFFLCSVSTS